MIDARQPSRRLTVRRPRSASALADRRSATASGLPTASNSSPPATTPSANHPSGSTSAGSALAPPPDALPNGPRSANCPGCCATATTSATSSTETKSSPADTSRSSRGTCSIASKPSSTPALRPGNGDEYTYFFCRNRQQGTCPAPYVNAAVAGRPSNATTPAPMPPTSIPPSPRPGLRQLHRRRASTPQPRALPQALPCRQPHHRHEPPDPDTPVESHQQLHLRGLKHETGPDLENPPVRQLDGGLLCVQNRSSKHENRTSGGGWGFRTLTP